LLDANGYASAIHGEFDLFGAGVADQVDCLVSSFNYDNATYALIAVDSDYQVTCEVRNVALAAAGSQRKPVWRYLFVHRFGKRRGFSTPEGLSHC